MVLKFLSKTYFINLAFIFHVIFKVKTGITFFQWLSKPMGGRWIDPLKGNWAGKTSKLHIIQLNLGAAHE